MIRIPESNPTNRQEDAVGQSPEYRADANQFDAHLAGLREYPSAVEEAMEILRAHAEEPHIRALLETPQSPGNHAEGPFVRDHYRTILTALALLRTGALPFRTVREFLGLPEECRDQWEATVSFLRDRIELAEAFAIGHDIAKIATIGFTTEHPAGRAAGFPSKREFTALDADARSVRGHELRKEYDTLFAEFAKRNADLDGPALQRSFAAAYGISVSYLGHGEAALDPAYAPTLEAISERCDLTGVEEQLLRFAIAEHINPLVAFSTEGRGAAYAEIANHARAAGLNPNDAMRALQMGVLLDGVLGSRQQDPHDPDARRPNAAPIRFFWEAERAYPTFLAERAERERRAAEDVRLRTLLRDTGLDGTAIQALGVPKGPEVGRMLRVITAAVREGTTLDAVPDAIRPEVERRVAAARTAHSAT